MNSPLSKFIEKCQEHRIESIHNNEYKYIKEIIWDTVAQEKYDCTRKGYDEYRKNNAVRVSHSGKVSLREITIDDEVVGYITETKRNNNPDYNIIYSQYELAKKELFKILDVKDIDNFNYWLMEEVSNHSGYGSCENTIISSIKCLEKIIISYNKDSSFKKYIDKIKG